MSRRELVFWFIAGVILCAAFLPLPARAATDMELMRDMVKDLTRVISEQNATIKVALERQQPFMMLPAQQPQIVQEKDEPCDDWLGVGCLLKAAGKIGGKVLTKGIDLLDRNFVPLLQIAAGDRAAARQARVGLAQAEFNYLERRDTTASTMGAIGGLGMNIQNVATAGFGTIGTMPTATTYNVNGAGINFGSGTLNYNPVTGSYNPVNPAPRVCGWMGTGLTATFVCQ